MQCGVDAGTTTPSPAWTVTGTSRSSIASVAWASTSSAHCAPAHRKARRRRTPCRPRPACRARPTPRSCRTDSRGGGVRTSVRVDVHRQAFAGVEQLDEQRRRRSPAGDVRRAEPAVGVGLDEVAEQPRLAEVGEAGRVAAPSGHGGGEPLLGPDGSVVPAERGRCARRHGRSARSRSGARRCGTVVVVIARPCGSRARSPGCRCRPFEVAPSNPSRRCRASSAPHRPSSTGSLCTTVTAGLWTRAASESLNATIAGVHRWRRSPASSPTVLLTFAANIAVGGSSRASSESTAGSTSAASSTPVRTRASSSVDAGGPERLAIARRGAGGSCTPSWWRGTRCAGGRGRQQLHAPPYPADVVGDDGVDLGADRGPVDAHHRRAAGRDARQVRLVGRGGHHEQCHHPPLDHRDHDLRFALGAVAGRRREDEAVAAADDGLDALQHPGPERVADARRDHADHRGRAAGAQQAGEVVRAEAELLGGEADAGDLVGSHVGLVVEGRDTVLGETRRGRRRR